MEFGVEMWKVTLSKSETTWSIDVGVALDEQSETYGQARLEGLGEFTLEQSDLLEGSQ